MSDNLRHWSALEKTDPKHTKPFDRGRFKGTATKPIWHELRMTEHFGPCGVAWGMDQPEFQLVPAGNEIVVYCTVAVWYMDDGKRATVYGVGGDKVLAVQRTGPFVSDEAFKAAFTDAIGNAMKHIGVGADIHMGLFEDNKYVAAAQREFADDGPYPSAQPQAPRDAGMVRAADVPPQKANGNGDATMSVERRATIFREEMTARFAKCKMPADVDTIIHNNGKALEGLKKMAPEVYAEVMQLSTNAKNALYGETG